MVQGSQVEQRQNGAVVIVSLYLLILVDVTVEIPGLEALGVLLPLALRVHLISVAQPGVQHQVDLQYNECCGSQV